VVTGHLPCSPGASRPRQPLRSWAALWLLVASALSACGAEPTSLDEDLGEVASAEVVCADGDQLAGIDVSYYQDQPDWNAVAATGLYFAITRVNHGDFMDPEFSTNWAAIKDVGMVRGAYQYFDPGGDPTVQATTLIDAVGTLQPGDMPAVLDVESTDGLGPAEIAAHVTTWVDLVEAATGRRPIIYTGSYFWNDNVQSTELADHPLWIAHYTQNCPNLPTAWSDWTLWQYSSTGTVAGIDGAVDLDHFNGSPEALQDLAANGYRATVVSLDYPSSMTPGGSGQVELVLDNVGARAWGESIRLGTSVPRDRASAFAASDWDADDRVMAMPQAVPAGETVTLEFTIVAPDEPGDYSEHFNLVAEGVAWFSDTPPGGGPADDEIALTITVDPSSGQGGGGGASGGAGSGGDPLVVGVPNTGGGGSCGLAGGPGQPARVWWLVALLCIWRRARRSDRSPSLLRPPPVR
jgi:lysozyme